MRTLIASVAFALLLVGTAAGKRNTRSVHLAVDNPWARVAHPTGGPAQSIGTYTAGCLQGAVQLPLRGPGYRDMRPLRRFGHPTLIEFVERLARRAHRGGLGLLGVGDLGQPRGGPSLRGHASHQIGLDVDIWYLPPDKARAPSYFGEPPERISVVDRRHGTLSPRWRGRVERLVRLAAKDPLVAKVLVNPVIKRRLCHTVKGNRQWLHKVEPFWGHYRHFHVQLLCPPDSPACRPRVTLPPGDGCAGLKWWFRAAYAGERVSEHKSYRAMVGTRTHLPELPARCQAVLEEPPRPAPRER